MVGARSRSRPQPSQRCASTGGLSRSCGSLGLGRTLDNALVFSSRDGSPYLPDTLTEQWRNTMKAAGLTATLHGLRHTHASTLIAAGLDVMNVSRRLGHGSPAITLGVYGHLFKPDDRAAAIMEKALAGTED